MAFNLATFRTRSLSAAVFVLVMLAGLLWNPWSFLLLFMIIHFGCWSEYQKLLGMIDQEYAQITPFHRYGVRLAGCCLLFFFAGSAFVLFGIKLHEIGLWLGLIFMFVLPLMELLFNPNIRPKNIGLSALGLVYISLSFALMIDLRSMNLQWFTKSGRLYDPGYVIPLAIVFSIWINDTMAYIVGSFIGRTPFSKISPKKTWEGTLGGIFLSVVVMGLIAYWLGMNYTGSAIIACIAAIAGTAGDLLESKLKRLAQVKDSGHLMPGHGGFLDRFDSLLIAIPFVWIFVKVVMAGG